MTEIILHDNHHPSTKEKEEDDDVEEETRNHNDDKDKNLTSKEILKQQRKEIIQFIQSELREQLIPLTFGTLAMIGSTLANQALPKLLGKLLDHSTTSSSSSLSASPPRTTTMSGTLIIVALGGGVASFVRTVF